MNYILIIIAISLFVICTFAILLYWLINLKQRKTFNQSFARFDEASENIAKLDAIIETCVGSVNSKMVSDLKKDSNFLQSDKEEAFNECKQMVYSMASPKNIEYMGSLGLNANAWINSRIEHFVRKQKYIK